MEQRGEIRQVGRKVCMAVELCRIMVVLYSGLSRYKNYVQDILDFIRPSGGV